MCGRQRGPFQGVSGQLGRLKKSLTVCLRVTDPCLRAANSDVAGFGQGGKFTYVDPSFAKWTGSLCVCLGSADYCPYPVGTANVAEAAPLAGHLGRVEAGKKGRRLSPAATTAMATLTGLP